MHPNLYLSVEYSSEPRRAWSHFVRLADTGAAPLAHALLGGREHQDVAEADCLKPKGWPDDVTPSALDEDVFTVDDELEASGVSDAIDNVRFCTRSEARQWVANGRSRYLGSEYKVTDPETYARSWLSPQELEALIAKCERYDTELIPVLRALAASMVRLKADGYASRVIYWFA